MHINYPKRATSHNTVTILHGLWLEIPIFLFIQYRREWAQSQILLNTFSAGVIQPLPIDQDRDRDVSE